VGGVVNEQHDGSAEDLAEYFLSGEGLSGVEMQPHDHGQGNGTSTSVREFDHRGHQVRIATTYDITIDGEPMVGHVEVLPSGQVHYHPFPQYAPNSAVDVVKAVIDTLWEKPPVQDELGVDDDGRKSPAHGVHQDDHDGGDRGGLDSHTDDGPSMDHGGHT
jgi:hypothetical protein